MKLRGKTFQLDRIEGKFMGVCSGLANYTGIDATIIRIGLVVVTVAGGFPWTLIAYGAAVWLGKPKQVADYGLPDVNAVRASRTEASERMRDIDLRMQAIETYVTSSNSKLANEIEELR